MPGKNKSAWKGLLTGLLVTAVVNFVGILLTTLLVMRGTLGEEQTFPLLAAAALFSAFCGGLAAGRGTLGFGGACLNAGGFCLLLIMICLSTWDEMITSRGLLILAMVLAGGLLSGTVCGEKWEASEKAIRQIYQKSKKRMSDIVGRGWEVICTSVQIWGSAERFQHHILQF